MHRSSPSDGRPPSALRRRGAVVLAIVCVLLCAGAIAALRQLGQGQRSGAHPPAAAGGAGSLAGGTAGQATPTATSASPSASTPTPKPSRTPKATPTPTPTPTHASPTPTVVTSATCTNPQFVTSDPTGGWTDGAYYLYNDMWNISGYTVTQTLYACSYNNWYVVANMNNDRGDGAVKTYPNVHEDFSSKPAISSFHSISSTFAETSPHTGIYEDAYDIWINGVASSGSTEVMVWTNNHGQRPAGSVQATATIGGRTYTVWRAGSYVAFVASTNVTSGTVNLLDVFNWIIAKGWMSASSTLGQIDYGAEIVSTGGAPKTFTFTNFAVTTS